MTAGADEVERFNPYVRSESLPNGQYGWLVSAQMIGSPVGEYVRATDYDALRSQVEALERDAARYRWLSSLPNRCDFIEHSGHHIVFEVDFHLLGKYGINCSDDLGAAIDSAMATAREHK